MTADEKATDMPGREDILRTGITKGDKILELGPSYNPLTPKAESWRSFVVDHADRAGLVKKYSHDPSVDAAKIEPVDFVWTQGALSDAVPVEHHGTFDVFLASHVLEHMPDLIAVLRSAEILCRPNAKMVLALPDKRVCFDFFRPLSTTGDVLAAHEEGRSRHSAKTLWDYFAYTANKHDAPGWGRTDQAPLCLIHSLNDAGDWSRKPNSNEYIDAHAWTFVPASLSLILFELAYLGLTDWQVERTEAAEHIEFYVWLRRGASARIASISPPDLKAERARLLDTMMLELDDQSRQLPASRSNDLESQLAATRSTLDAVRSSRTWRFRLRLRKFLGLPPTSADH